MARYEYRANNGDRIEVEAPMTAAPPVGHRIRRNGRIYRRVVSRMSVSVPASSARSARIEAWSLEQRDQMDPELHRYVDGWNAHGVACFDSEDSAQRFAGATRDRVEKTGEGRFYDFGDGPSGIEADAANQARKRIKFDK